MALVRKRDPLLKVAHCNAAMQTPLKSLEMASAFALRDAIDSDDQAGKEFYSSTFLYLKLVRRVCKMKSINVA